MGKAQLYFSAEGSDTTMLIVIQLLVPKNLFKPKFNRFKPVLWVFTQRVYSNFILLCIIALTVTLKHAFFYYYNAYLQL